MPDDFLLSPHSSGFERWLAIARQTASELTEQAVCDAVATLASHDMADQTALVVRGTCVESNGKATLVMGPGYADVAAQLGQVVIADLVLVRVTLTRQVDGVQLAPTLILTERGQEIRGADICRWLREDAYQEPRADVFCLNLAQRDEPVMARDLDLGRCAEPYAYPLAKAQAHFAPPLITEAVILRDGAPIKLSSDLAPFTAHLMADQPWLPDKVTHEVLAAIQCQSQAKTVGPRAKQNKPGLFSRWRT